MVNRRRDSASDSASSESAVSEAEYSDMGSPVQTATAMFDKDSDEEELERLVLGTNTGFRDNLFKGEGLFDTDRSVNGKDVMAIDEGGLEDVEDNDLFMFDTGPAKDTPRKTKAALQTDAEELPAWDDSDDDRIAVSLAGVNRLRKLRETEAEDVISGREYTRRLRQQYLRLNPMPAWAKQEQRPSKRSKKQTDSDSSDESGMDSDTDLHATPMNEFLRDINRLTGRDPDAARPLQPTTINIQRTRPIPDKHRAPVESLSFHPKYPVLLSASTASVLHLHHIDPEAQPTPNPSLTSVQTKQVDVRRAEFLYPQGDQIFLAGRRRYFHHWDLPSGVVQKTSRIQGHRFSTGSMENFRLSPCGRYMAIVGSGKKGGGNVFVLSTTSSQLVTEAKLTSTHGIADVAWWRDGEGMTILGRDNTVGEYSMRERAFLATWLDEGGTGATCIALGGYRGPENLGGDAWVAIGSNSGICTLYNRDFLLETPVKERPSPARTFENLITSITVVTFSPDGQLLAYGSKEKKDALRLVHVASQTIYNNWPTAQTPLGRVTAVAFARKSDMLAIGNDSGKIRLWEIRS